MNYVTESYKYNPNVNLQFTDTSISLIESNLVTRGAKGKVTKKVWTSPVTYKIYLNNELSSNIALGISSSLVAHNNTGKGVIVSGVLLLVPIPSTTFYWIKSQ